MQRNLRLKSDLTKSIRDYLEKNKFVDIETPILTKDCENIEWLQAPQAAPPTVSCRKRYGGNWEAELEKHKDEKI